MLLKIGKVVGVCRTSKMCTSRMFGIQEIRLMLLLECQSVTTPKTRARRMLQLGSKNERKRGIDWRTYTPSRTEHTTDIHKDVYTDWHRPTQTRRLHDGRLNRTVKGEWVELLTRKADERVEGRIRRKCVSSSVIGKEYFVELPRKLVCRESTFVSYLRRPLSSLHPPHLSISR